jgi:acetyltransferase-like isoleucine patch superfamily enzyme
MKNLLYWISFLLPWALRRRLLVAAFGYRIHPTSYIGFAWVMPKQLILDPHSQIGTLTVCRGLQFLHLKQNAVIGRANWISGHPAGEPSHFAHQVDRRPELIVGEHSAITNRHLIDCTSSVTIGAFTTFAGYRSQILTHSIDLENSRQSSAPITVGDYCFIGTDCVLLGGTALPDHSVLGAKSLLNKQYSEPYWLYAGNPARPVKRLADDLGYFRRQIGFVN